jgi:hypothetical protein
MPRSIDDRGGIDDDLCEEQFGVIDRRQLVMPSATSPNSSLCGVPSAFSSGRRFRAG